MFGRESARKELGSLIEDLRRQNPNSDPHWGHKAWLAEVQFLGAVNHPNLVKLPGYCSINGERGIQRLLVYEYMPNRSLEDHLFNRALNPLPWITRLQIMLGAAQGLAYLHEELEVQNLLKFHALSLSATQQWLITRN
ncbi:probable serine/threonine-protein kinase PBL19 isoform X2 [Rosa rugosa]|uniref:probable serine/threonine-protein kinase PBL19 isoform X2 n=1 Tax=Rosa rugosa TaxID=74645 RepID=UPI002B417053|nr:probable serine/threonine-protein kinase PBL19 isoform X2 [Rosa rugosa]